MLRTYIVIHVGNNSVITIETAAVRTVGLQWAYNKAFWYFQQQTKRVESLLHLLLTECASLAMESEDSASFCVVLRVAITRIATALQNMSYLIIKHNSRVRNDLFHAYTNSQHNNRFKLRATLLMPASLTNRCKRYICTDQWQ